MKHPSILWAQRSPLIYLSVEVEDMRVEELSIHEDNFKIRGTKGGETYQADLKLFAKVKGTECRQIATDRRVELIIPKEKEEWWPRLLQEKTKVPWLKVDFDKWVDEDEEGGSDREDFGGLDFSSMGLPGGDSFNSMNFDNDDIEDADEDEEPAELEDIKDAGDGKTPKDQ